MRIKLDENAIMPTRGHVDDAGLDLYCTEDLTVPAYGSAVAETGVHVEIPRGYVGLLTSKSGLMLRGITCRGTIDSGYTGAIKAVVFNHSGEDIRFDRGNKVVQLVLLPCLTPNLIVVDDLEDTDRGAAGFGSTGR